MLMAIIAGVDLSFVSFMTHLCCQFRLLNASVTRMKERALYQYKRKGGILIQEADLLNDPEFQRSMSYSLRENIKHHQILLE